MSAVPNNNQMIRVIEIDRPDGSSEVRMYHTKALTNQAEFANELCVRLALVEVEDRSEPTGKRFLTEKEVVDRALEIAKLAYSGYGNRNWVINIPVPKLSRKERGEQDDPSDNDVAERAGN